jgi:hypothetical protein
MINIQVNGIFLELGDAKITLEIYNALLQVGIVRDNFSYAFTIPRTAPNEQALGSIGNVASTDMHQTEPEARIFLYRALWAVGLCSVEEASIFTGYKIKLNFDYGAFARAIGDKKLADVYNSTLLDITDRQQGITTVATNYRRYFVDMEWFFPFPPPIPSGTTVTLYFILRNGSVVANAGFTYPINDMEQVTNQLVDSFNANSAVNTDFRCYYRKDEGVLLSRAIDLLPFAASNTDTWVLRRTETDTTGTFPPTVTDIDFTTRNEQQPIPNNAYTHICFPRIRATDFYNGKNDDFLGVLNDDLNGAYYYNTSVWLAVASPAEPDNYNRYAHCPCLRLFSLITHICKSVGWTWEGDLATDTVLENLLVYSNYASDQQVQIGSYFFNEHQRTIFFGTLCPDLSIKEFFEQLQEHLCLWYDFDVSQKIMYLNFKQPVFASTDFEDMARNFAPRREIREVKRNVLLKYKDDLEIADFFGNNATQGTYQNTDTLEVRTGAMPYELPAYPAMWQKSGNSPMFGLGLGNNRKMYLFFWRGLQTVNGTVNRPTAEALDDYGTGSLEWTYLYPNYWEGFTQYLLTNKKQEGVLWIELDFVKRALRSLGRKYKYDNLAYLIERIQCEITADSDNIAGAKIEVRKLGL